MTILDWSNLTVSADHNSNVAQKMKYFFDRVIRKHCAKRRKCWLPAFSPFPTLFSKAFFERVVKTWDCVVKG